MITVLTATYNRGYIISKAYESLKNQTDKNFEWVVVDDGSTDNTEELFKKFTKEKIINIRYFKKENGGKHTAVNLGTNKAKGDWIIGLDSDDFFDKDAIKIINKYTSKYKDNKKIASVTFCRVNHSGKVLSKEYKEEEIIANYIDFRYNNNNLADMAEAYKTSILREYVFPVFEDEKFLSEAIVWNKIALKYDTVYVNQGIYVCEYLNDGLSKNSLMCRINCPIGSYENAKLFMNKKFKLKIRLKNAILYIGFYLLKHKKAKDIFKYVEYKWLVFTMYPFGLLFLLYLKYNKKNNKEG